MSRASIEVKTQFGDYVMPDKGHIGIVIAAVYQWERYGFTSPPELAGCGQTVLDLLRAGF